MFSNDIVGSDAFFEMPSTTQALYFHLGMRCDDDGFVNPNVTMRMTGANKNDLDVLISKRFLIPFQNGVVVIKHHRINNNWDARDCRRTLYTEELKQLFIKENNAYTLNEEKGENVSLKYPKRDKKIKELLTPTGTRREPDDRIEENRIEEIRIEKNTYSEFKNVKLSEEEYQKLIEKLGENNTNILIEELGGYLASTNKRYSSHYATLLNWARRKVQTHQEKLQIKKRTII